MIDILPPIPFSQSLSIHAKKVIKNKMVSTRYNIFGYAIIFMSLHFVAYSLQDMEMPVMSRNKIEGVMLSRSEKINHATRDDVLKSRKNVFFHIETPNVVPIGSKVTVKGGPVGGRKMARMVNEERMNMKDEETASVPSSSENPSNNDHKPHKRSKKIYHDNHQVKGKMSSTFMVMNADYHVPRSHPPKNN